jgi:hypothetical protein
VKLASQTPKIFIKIFECSENRRFSSTSKIEILRFLGALENCQNPQKIFDFFGTVKREAFEHWKSKISKG